MKYLTKTAIAAFILSFSAFATADALQSSSASGDQRFNELCKAALTSDKAFKIKARELNISKSQRDRLVCNEMTVATFAQNHQLTEHNTIATVQ